MIGQTLGHYRVLELLGKGGVGEGETLAERVSRGFHGPVGLVFTSPPSTDLSPATMDN